MVNRGEEKVRLYMNVVPRSTVTEDLIRRSWVRFPPRSKDFFFASCGYLFPFIWANAQWVIHGLSRLDFQPLWESGYFQPWCGARNAGSQNGWKSSLGFK